MAGIRHTLRVVVDESARKELTFERVFKDVLMAVGSVTVSSVFCIQDFPGQGLYDVSFTTEGKCLDVFERLRRNEGRAAVMDVVKIIPLFQHDERMLTTHMYNPFVDESIIRTFLSRYCVSIRGGDKLKNMFGIFNGKRRYFVRFRQDKDSVGGGVKQPPAVFSIGGERGFLFFQGQAQFCRSCHEYGHTKEDCVVGVCCRNCKQVGHTAAACGAPRVCDLCGVAGHIARMCPARSGDLQSGIQPGPRLICSKCQTAGHLEADCPQSVVCGVCKTVGHVSALCPTAPKPQRSYSEVLQALSGRLVCGDTVLEAMEEEGDVVGVNPAVSSVVATVSAQSHVSETVEPAQARQNSKKPGKKVGGAPTDSAATDSAPGGGYANAATPAAVPASPKPRRASKSASKSASGVQKEVGGIAVDPPTL